MNFQSHIRAALMARTARTKALRLEQARVRKHMETCKTCQARAVGGHDLGEVLRNALGLDEPHLPVDAKPRAH